MKNRISLFVLAHGEPTEPDDRSVPGYWQVSVDADLPEDLRASAALDVFHGKVGVDNLDDFSFSVFGSDGAEIHERADQESYQLEHRGHLDGAVETDDLPFTPAAAPAPG